MDEPSDGAVPTVPVTNDPGNTTAVGIPQTQSPTLSGEDSATSVPKPVSISHSYSTGEYSSPADGMSQAVELPPIAD